jgi:predicted dehydrogenase
MNETETDVLGVNRRDFLKGGSAATIMSMLGGVELFAETADPAVADSNYHGAKIKVAVIGLGAWGRDILNTLARTPQAEVVAICDNYPAFLKRSAALAPNAKPVADYKALFDDKDIKAVVIATPTHAHKDLVLAALKAGKHVYCEAPLANTIEDARAIALAAKAAKQSVFQAGLQLRADPQRHFLVPFIRSGAVGQPIMARAQWHKKQSWRATSPNPEREKAMNWRLSKETSLGLLGEIGIHQIDQAAWFLNGRPLAITGMGSTLFWKDGRDVADTVQVMLEFPGGVFFTFDASLANSFDAEYAILYGSDAAVMVRENKAWMFKEVDSPLLGWEVYARKETFYRETGIALVANASKSVPASNKPGGGDEITITSSALFFALQAFLNNAIDVEVALGIAQDAFKDDSEAIAEEVSRVQRRPVAGFLEGYRATVTAIKANEAVVTGKRVELKPEMYELS